MKCIIAAAVLTIPLAAQAQTDAQLSQCLTLGSFAFQVTVLRDKGVPMENHLLQIADKPNVSDGIKRLFGGIVRDIYLTPGIRRASPAEVQVGIFKSCLKAVATY